MKDTLGRENRKLMDKVCAQCGKTFRPARKEANYCSRPCMWKNNGGHNKKEESWWKNIKGYIEGRIWSEGKQQRVRQHRVVMERHLGRKLEPNEDIHHINGIKDDNRLENLELITHSKHSTKSNNERTHKNGYKLKLTDEERERRSEQMRKNRKR